MVTNEDEIFSLRTKRCQDVTLKNLAGLFHQQHTRSSSLDIIAVLGCRSRGASNYPFGAKECSICMVEFVVNLTLGLIVQISDGAKVVHDVLPQFVLPFSVP